LYVDGELPAATIQRRVRLLRDPTKDWTKNLHVVSRDILLRQGLDLPDLGKVEGRDFLDRIIQRYQIEVMFLDSLSTLIESYGTGKNASENAAESWTQIQRWLIWHRCRGRTIVLIHHEGRSGLPRGTSNREVTLDTTVRLQSIDSEVDSEQDDTSSFRLSFSKRREFIGNVPLILRLSTASGVDQWSWEQERDITREQVLELAQAGMKQADIAKAVGLKQPQVSKILAKAKLSQLKAKPDGNAKVGAL
jgi:putative DNA primase/helicase